MKQIPKQWYRCSCLPYSAVGLRYEPCTVYVYNNCLQSDCNESFIYYLFSVTTITSYN